MLLARWLGHRGLFFKMNPAISHVGYTREREGLGHVGGLAWEEYGCIEELTS
jgi:hypothetical protein